MCSVVMGEDRQTEAKTGLLCDKDSITKVHDKKEIMNKDSKLRDTSMEWSNCNGNEIDETNRSITSNNKSSFKPQDEVKYRRVSESSIPHGEVCQVPHHVKRRVLNGGVSPVTEETFRNRTMNSENFTYRSRSQTPTRLELSNQKTRLKQENRHLPTWDIIDTDVDRRTRSLYGASPNCKFGPKASIMKSQAAVLTIQDPRSQRLTWYKPPLSVLVIKKIFDAEVIKPYLELITWLVEKKMVVFVESKSHEELIENPAYSSIKSRLCTFKENEDDLTDKIDFIICLGGDGTLLYASSLFQQSVPPVMAFYWGSLGFLAPFQFTDFRKEVIQVLEGNAGLVLRTRLKAVVCRQGRCPAQEFDPSISLRDVESKQHILVLNEVVVDRGPCPYLTNIDLYIEHRYVTSVQADGLIIATPTGSTAYAAAAGASMVHPNVPAIIITPVCPHSLSFRPIVVPAGVEIKICVSDDSRSNAWVSFDGRKRQEIGKGDAVRISTSIYPVPSICRQDQISDWFDTLVGCLHWNQRKPQQAFDYHSDYSLSAQTSNYSPESSDNNSYTNGNSTD